MSDPNGFLSAIQSARPSVLPNQLLPGGILRFNSKRKKHGETMNFTGPTAGAPDSTTITALIAALQSQQLAQQQAAQQPQAQVIVAPVQVPVARKSSLIGEIFNFVFVVGIGSLLIGGLTKHGKTLLHKAGLWSQKNGEFKLPDPWKDLKLSELPGNLAQSFTEAFTDIDQKYKEGIAASSEELTLGHFSQAFNELLQASPGQASKLFGVLSGKVGNVFDAVWRQLSNQTLESQFSKICKVQNYLSNEFNKTESKLSLESSDGDKAAFIRNLKELDLPVIHSEEEEGSKTQALSKALAGASGSTDAELAEHFQSVYTAAEAFYKKFHSSTSEAQSQ
jgi:hypothetical protein